MGRRRTSGKCWECFHHSIRSASTGFTLTARRAGSQDAASVAAKDGEADSTLTLTPDSLEKMIAGGLDPTFAYMTGKLKISGSMGVALKLAAMLED